MSPARVGVSGRTPFGMLIASLSIVALTVMAVTGYLVWSSYQETIRDAEIMTRNYAAILEARLDATLRRVDADLWELANTIPAAALSRKAVPKYARELNADLDLHMFNFMDIAGLRVADRHGDTLYSSASASTRRVNISDRDYFRLLRDTRNSGPVFSEVITGRSTGRAVVAIARSLKDGRGDFIGIVYALLEIEHFQMLFQSLTIGPKGMISLRRSDDHRLVVRRPQLPGELNLPLNPQHPVTRQIAAGDRTATLQFANQTDGIQRIVSYHVLEAYPFYISIGVDRDDVLAQWRARALTVGASNLLLLGLLVWLLLRLWRAVRSETRVATELRESAQALHESTQELRLFTDNVPAITVSWDENLRCRFANKAFAAIFGLAVEDVIGKHLRELYGEDVYREIEGHFARALQGQPETYQRTHTFANGETRYLEVKLLPHTGDQGKVLGCFAVTTDITEHKLAEERIQRMAHHDSLTGLPNRLLFNDRLEQAISLAKRDSRQFALLYLDLDKFKPVNDTLGHNSGDELLQAVAARIRHEVRESDTVARVGGDEFTVILPGIGQIEEAETVAKKIIAALTAPFQLGGQNVVIGSSIGISVYPTDARNADALVKAADVAMYGAKQLGNNFRFYGV